MNILTRISAFVVFLFCSQYAISQDLTLTISGKYDGKHVPLDSILIENPGNGSRILYADLPAQTDYVLRLPGGDPGDPGDPVSVGDLLNGDIFRPGVNKPGRLNIYFLQDRPAKARLSVYNTQGQLLYSNSSLMIRSGQSLEVCIGNSGVYIVRLETDYGSATFKAIGAPGGGNISSEIREIPFNSQDRLKSASGASEFIFSVGDSIRISVYRKNLYARPVEMRPEISGAVSFLFRESYTENYGISDAWVFPDEDIRDQLIYDPENGNIELDGYGEELQFHTGDILTIDLDSTGVLRKIIKVRYENNRVYLETVQAGLDELFVDLHLKLSTEFMGSPAQPGTAGPDLIESLRDMNGFLHPAEIIYRDDQGILSKKSAFSGNEDTVGSVQMIDLLHDFSGTSMYGNPGENIHLYFEEGTASFSSDAVFELDVSFEGEIDRRSKVKLGQVRSFDYQVHAVAEFNTDLFLDLKSPVDQESKVSIHNFREVCAKFLIPPGVPLWVTMDPDILGRFELTADSSLHAGWHFDNKPDITAGAHYDAVTNSFTPVKESEMEYTSHPLNLQGDVNAGIRLELYPRVDIGFYNRPGPFTEIVPYTEGIYHSEMKTRITPTGEEPYLSWESRLDYGLDLRLGADMEFLSNEDREMGPEVLNGSRQLVWKSPENIILSTTLPDVVEPGGTYELGFRVTDLIGLPVPLCPVYIAGDGEFSRYISLTGSDGEVSVEWTIKDISDHCSFEAAILNDDRFESTMIEKSIPVRECLACETNTLLDPRDSAVYQTVKIGEQVWMAENLAYLPYVTPATDISPTEPYIYVYGYRGSSTEEARAGNYFKDYGVLYNWTAANNVCPEGWHLPSDEEWKKLEIYLGMNPSQADEFGWRGSNQGALLKETGTDHWYSPNNQASNTSGFTATPGGYFSEGSHYTWEGVFGKWWTSTEYGDEGETAWHRVLHFTTNQVYRSANFREHGYSVRCVKD